MQQLGGFDSALLYLESKATPMHVGGMVVYDPATAPDGSRTYEQIRATLRQRLGNAPALRRILVRVPFELDNPWWADADTVDLDYHVTRVALPGSADWRELCTQVTNFLSRPLDLERPLWELRVIEGLGAIEGYPPDAFAVALKVHHASVDGVSGMDLFSTLHDLQPNPPVAPMPPTEVAGHGSNAVPSPIALLGRAIPNAVLKPARLLRRTAALLPRLPGIGVSAATGGDSSSGPPATRFDSATTGGRIVGGISLSLDEVKSAKNAISGATVNDVLLAVVGGGLRHYLDKSGELPARSLVAATPISVRTGDDTDGGNRLALATAHLGTDIADPVERVRTIQAETARGKAERDDTGARALLDIADAIPAGFLDLGARLISGLDLSRKARLCNTGVTNVPGPSSPIYLCGAKAVEVYGFALVAPGMNLVNMVSSYHGRITIGFQATADALPDPEQYESCLRVAFDELVAATR